MIRILSIKREIKLSHLRAVYLLAALIVLGIGGFYFYRHTFKEATQQSRTEQTQSLATFATIPKIISASLENKYPYLSKTSIPTQSIVGYQLPGYNFQVILPTNTDTIALTDQRTSNENTTYSDFNSMLPEISNDLYQQGFKTVSNSSQGDTFLSSIYFYKSHDAVCQVNLYTLMEINCSLTSQLASIATQGAPLLSVYTESVSNTDINAITLPTIQPSSTSGYTTAILPIFNNIGETMVYFYRLDNGSWQLVNLNWYNDPHEDGSPIPNCEDFESVVAVRQAFYGKACYDSTLRIETTIN
jgi:hypothetical protein